MLIEAQNPQRSPFSSIELVLAWYHNPLFLHKRMSQGTTYVYRLHLPPMVAETPKVKEVRPSPSSLDPEIGPQAKRPKHQQENPFDMLHLECFTYVMSFLGGRGLTVYVPTHLGSERHKSFLKGLNDIKDAIFTRFGPF